MLLGAEEWDEAALRRLLRAGGAARSKVMKNWGVIGGIAAALAASVYVLWGPITERKKRRKGLVPGLLNLGNTCFMNSLLQGLSACPSLIKWLEGFTVQYKAAQSETPGRQCLSLTLLHLLKALSCQEVVDDELLDASCLLEVLRTYRWQISSFEEQDAHELFHVLTSSLEDERDRQPRVMPLFDVHSLEQPEIPQKQIHCRTRGSPHPLSSHWKLQHPFHGRLTSNIVCKNCKHQSPLRYDTFDSLSLSIPATVWGHPLTLDHCLHHFISSESVKDVVCDNCTQIQADRAVSGHITENRRTTFVKQLKLGKLPQCLCIHLQRLSWSNQGVPLKRNEHVQFGEFLVMDLYKHRFPAQKSSPRGDLEPSPSSKEGTRPKSPDTALQDSNKSALMNGSCSHSQWLSSPIAFPYVAVPDCGSPAYLYRLMAVVVHHGDMHSGHFVTYRRFPPSSKNLLAASNQWLWISDDVVRKTTLQEVLSSSAYLLFYERIHSRRQHQSQEFRPEE
ncbi:ubiquitin carboxyl-terminal hydrolase 30 [Tiliqua scincoides]|uniref:ubiquitin carboxyl-terminal hydrolase 30 n=1 Tax=Tiliqua scincoides TaxID=71010 RepID=UPI003463403A